MKIKRLRTGFRDSASSGHKALGNLLRSSSLFKGNKIYQEYPVNKLNPAYKSGREKFDWVILNLKVVIEVMGAQHYAPVTFGGRPSEAEARFKKQVVRDSKKKLAAEEAGFTYVAITDTVAKKITDQELYSMLEKIN
jgi:very-short-patch-repair endonuclease